MMISSADLIEDVAVAHKAIEQQQLGVRLLTVRDEHLPSSFKLHSKKH